MHPKYGTIDFILIENYSEEFEARVRQTCALNGLGILEGFFKEMKNRLMVGQIRYSGGAKSNLLNPAYRNWMLNLIPRLQAKYGAFNRTGNTELLVDIGNYAMLQYLYPTTRRAWDSGVCIGTRGYEMIPTFLSMYKDFHDGAYLVTIAVTAMQERNLMRHPKAHFEAADQSNRNSDSGSLPMRLHRYGQMARRLEQGD